MYAFSIILIPYSFGIFEFQFLKFRLNVQIFIFVFATKGCIVIVWIFQVP